MKHEIWTGLANRGPADRRHVTIDTAPASTGSTVPITERGEVYETMFCLIARYVFGYTATQNGYLSELHAHFNCLA